VEVPWIDASPKRQRYLVGVSGGADSVALLHLLVEAGFHNLVVCHLNHGLRGRESGLDARFVDRLAARLGLRHESAKVDVSKRIKLSGESLETAARHARHEFFGRCAAAHRCNRLMLAHHADDQAETVLWNLLRGSHGLRGMGVEQQIQVGRRKLTLIRPLLEVRHAQLVEWLQERGLSWREDASNAEPIAVRNRLRNEALPLLEEISGRDVVAALSRGASDAAELGAFIQRSVEEARVLDPQGRLHLPTLRGLHPVLQRAALKRYLQSRSVIDIDRPLLDRAVGLLDTGSAPAINLPGGGRLRRRAGRIWFEP